MRFGSNRQQREWLSEKANPVLRQLVVEAEEYARVVLGWEFVVLDVWRTLQEEKDLGGTGVHHAWRAADVRVRTRSWDDPNALSLATYMNTLWEYDPARPQVSCVLFRPHETATGAHVHFQVHILTVRRGLVAPQEAIT